MKWICRRTSDQSPALDHETKVGHAKVINLLTMHSCRVTLLDAAVDAGRSAEEIGLQANWIKPVVNSAVMIKQLVKDLVQENHPVQEDDQTMLFDLCDSELSSIEFYTSNSPARAAIMSISSTATQLSIRRRPHATSSILLTARRWEILYQSRLCSARRALRLALRSFVVRRWRRRWTQGTLMRSPRHVWEPWLGPGRTRRRTHVRDLCDRSFPAHRSVREPSSHGRSNNLRSGCHTRTEPSSGVWEGSAPSSPAQGSGRQEAVVDQTIRHGYNKDTFSYTKL